MTNCLNKAWRSTRYFLRIAMLLVTFGLVVHVNAQQTDKGDLTNSWQPPLDELGLPPPTDHEANKRLLNYIRPRAESGDAAAEYKFGCCYFQGRLVAKDDVEAVKWFRRAGA